MSMNVGINYSVYPAGYTEAMTAGLDIVSMFLRVKTLSLNTLLGYDMIMEEKKTGRLMLIRSMLQIVISWISK